jgi:plasmid maintenance system antidote protein VapI/uncharacterized phage-associated protein
MATEFDKKLGVKIKRFREREIGISQEELAKRLGIDRVTMSNIENGRRRITPEETAKLSKIFNITSDILLDLEKDIQVTLAPRTISQKKNPVGPRINVPQKNISKFKEVLLYILKQVASKPHVGETVLYKLLYFIDFDYYEKYEEQLIGATYIKNHHGPTPKEFLKIVDEMKGKDLMLVRSQYFKYPQKKYLPLREPDLSKLSATEIKTIDQVLERLSDMNATDISAYSHNDVPWLTTEDGKPIDYESVFYRTPPYSVRSYDGKDIQ